VLTFRPPRWPDEAWPVVALGEVVRASLRRRRSDSGSSGMGVRFIDVTREDRDGMIHRLRGLPPPLPRSARPRVVSPAVDVEASFALDDGQRVTFASIGPLLTGGRPTADGIIDESTLPPALRLAC
jgi:hypothetical protein